MLYIHYHIVIFKAALQTYHQYIPFINQKSETQVTCAKACDLNGEQWKDQTMGEAP